MLATVVVSIDEAVSRSASGSFGSNLIEADLAVQARSAGGLDESLVRQVRAVAGTAPALAVVQVNSHALGSGDGAELSVLGLQGPARLFVPDGVTASVGGLARPLDRPPLVVGEPWLRQHHLQVGDRVELETSRGPSTWEIAGAISGDVA